MTAETVDRTEEAPFDPHEEMRLVELRVQMSERVEYDYAVRAWVPVRVDLGDDSALSAYLEERGDHLDSVPVYGHLEERGDLVLNPATRTVYLSERDRDLEGVQVVGAVDESTGAFVLGGPPRPGEPEAAALYTVSFLLDDCWMRHPKEWGHGHLEEVRAVARRLRKAADKVRVRGQLEGQSVLVEEI